MRSAWERWCRCVFASDASEVLRPPSLRRWEGGVQTDFRVAILSASGSTLQSRARA